MKHWTKLLVLPFFCVGTAMAAENREIPTEEFHELDSDSNEHISHQEVVDTDFIDLFSAMDRNSDGRVSLREYKSYKVANPDPSEPKDLDSDQSHHDELPREPTSFNE